MDDINSYNQVDSLQNNRLRVPAITTGGISVAGLLIIALNPPLLSTPSLAITGAGLICCIAMSIKLHTSKQLCRHCRRPLSRIERPFLLKNHHLKHPGAKLEQAQYFLLAQGSANPRWHHLQQHSRACHHCRLFEKSYTESSTPASAAQSQQLGRQTSPSR